MCVLVITNKESIMTLILTYIFLALQVLDYFITLYFILQKILIDLKLDFDFNRGMLRKCRKLWKNHVINPAWNNLIRLIGFMTS